MTVKLNGLDWQGLDLFTKSNILSSNKIYGYTVLHIMNTIL